MRPFVRNAMRRSCIALVAGGLFCAGGAEAACNIAKVLELPITMDGPRPMVQATINGTPVMLVVETSVFASQLAPKTAKQINLPREPAPAVSLRAVGGNVFPDRTTVKALGIGGQTLTDRSFLVATLPGDAPGVIGQDLWGAFDVEYDFGHGMMRLFKPTGCGDAPLAYWAGERAVSVVPMVWPGGREPRVTGMRVYASLNGQRVRVAFSSASGSTTVNEKAALEAGIKLGAADVVPAGVIHGEGQKPVTVSIARFESFKLGGEEVRNTRLRVGDLGVPAEVVVGSDFFRSHRIYVSNSQHKMYITYEGGPIFGAPTQALEPDVPAAH